MVLPKQAPESLMEVKGNPWRLTKSEVANATIAVKKDTIPATAKNPAKNKETVTARRILYRLGQRDIA